MGSCYLLHKIWLNRKQDVLFDIHFKKINICRDITFCLEVSWSFFSNIWYFELVVYNLLRQMCSIQIKNIIFLRDIQWIDFSFMLLLDDIIYWLGAFSKRLIWFWMDHDINYIRMPFCKHMSNSILFHS